MKIEYIGHSALLISTSDLKLLTDPWLTGAAYCNQWHLFPKPGNTEVAQEADVVLISHGHEDHLHHESLLSLNKKSRIFYPFQWQGGIRDYLTGIGYLDVVEAVSHRTYRLSKGTTVTYIANSLDSIMVIEADGEVMVNINDALPANHKNIIAAFLTKIKKRWPRIDHLFCSYGSAAYFPNTVHCEGKDDVEVAEAREQMFAENFCFIVDELMPSNVIPFAADYVLLNDEKRWINRVKYSKEKVKKYYHEVYKGRPTQFMTAHSGDVIEKGVLTRNSSFHESLKEHSLDHLIDTCFAEEIRSVNELRYLGENDVAILEKAMRANVEKRRALFSTERLARIKYTVIVKDIQRDNRFYIDCSGATVEMSRGNVVHADSILTIETTSAILHYCFASEWGGDAIVIGYGAEINIVDLGIIEEGLDVVCVRLLTNQPVASKQMKASPFRALRYLITNPLTTSWAVEQAIKGRRKVVKNPMNERSIWLRKSKCEICQVCDVPMLSHDFAEGLK